MAVIAGGWPDAVSDSGLTSNPLTDFSGTLAVLVVLAVISGRLLGVRLHRRRVLLAGFPAPAFRSSTKPAAWPGRGPATC